MAADTPSDENRRDAIRIALYGLGSGHDLSAIARLVEPLHPRHNTFPAEVFLELAADAIEIAGASRQHPIAMEELAKRFCRTADPRARRTASSSTSPCWPDR